jgi:hypothetical protein
VAAALALVHRHHHPLPLPQLRRPRGHRPATRVLDRSSFSLSHRSQAALNLLLLQAIGAVPRWRGFWNLADAQAHMAATRRAEEQTFVDPRQGRARKWIGPV